MDIINLYENYNERERESKNNFFFPKERVTTAKPYYNSYFNEDLRATFEKISKVASSSNYKLYLIGGLVRDLLLNRVSLDIDITVEGNAIEFATVLESNCNAKILSVHKDFGTVKIELDGEKIDLASTRSETYPKKGHLPHVAEIGCSLEKDVLRRDFTINSLALSLNQNNFADLIDYVGGFEDLKSKKIKILHEKSFIDDPTRIIRALKYATRLGFELDKNTFELQEKYLKNINYDMGNKRMKQEIKKTFEDCTQETFDKFIEQKIYKLITPKEIKKHKINLGNLINDYKPKHTWIVYLGTIAVLEEDDFCDKLELTKIEKNIIVSAKSLLNSKLEDDFELYKAFSGQKLETLLILAALDKDKEIQVLHFLKDLQRIKLHINGNDLLSLGIAPSKAFSEGFDFVLKEKLKNPLLHKKEELEIIKKYLSKT